MRTDCGRGVRHGVIPFIVFVGNRSDPLQTGADQSEEANSLVKQSIVQTICADVSPLRERVTPQVRQVQSTKSEQRPIGPELCNLLLGKAMLGHYAIRIGAEHRRSKGR